VRITITVKHGIAPPEEADDLAAEPGAEPPQDDAQPADRFMFVEADARPVVGGADGFAIEKGRGGPDDFVNAPAAPDIEGTSAGEILSGTAEGEAIWGYAGDDIIAGLGGDDELRGGLGDDTIFGGEGDDLIGGFLGTDELTGGAGADGFLFQDVDTDYQDIGVDIITDFDLAEDYLVFAEDFFAGGGALADNLIALQGVGGVELYADSAISGLVQIAFLEGVDAAAMQALIANESILG
jgi:Ca2+-binding RTX toxin-like protein